MHRAMRVPGWPKAACCSCAGRAWPRALILEEWMGEEGGWGPALEQAQ